MVGLQMRAEDIQTMGVETIGDSLKLQRSIARLRVEGWLGEAIPYQSLISGADFDGSAPTVRRELAMVKRYYVTFYNSPSADTPALSHGGVCDAGQA